MIFTKADAEKLIRPNLQIKEVVIPEGFTEIEDYCCFGEATELEKVVLPESITKIGERSFSGCKKLSQVNFPKNLKEIGYYAFSNTGFTELNLPSTLEKFIGAFYHCDNLSKVTLSKADFSRAFESCPNLKDVNLNEGIEEISDDAFQDTGIEKIKLPSTVKKISSSAFKNCKNLSDVELNEGLEEIKYYAFSGTNISKIKLPSSLKIISGFDETPLSDIEFPLNIEEIGEGAFENCVNLTKVSIPENCHFIGFGAFKDCKNLKEVILPKEIKYRKSEDDSEDFKCINQIGKCAFFGCESLSKIQLPSNLEKIGAESFKNCKNLKEINLPESLKTIERFAFANCGFSGRMDTKNALIAFSSFNGCSLTELECCFDNDYYYTQSKLEIESLEKLIINNEIKLEESTSYDYSKLAPNNIKELVLNKKVSEIGYGAFERFDCLQKIEFNGGLENYVYESNCLYDANKKRLIRAMPSEINVEDKKIKFVIPEAVKEFGIRSFPFIVEEECVEIEIKGTIKKVFEEAVDGYSKERERNWRVSRKPSKAVGGAKIIYSADKLKKAKDNKINEIKAVGIEGLINAAFDGWNLGFSKKEKYEPKRITYIVNLPFNASFDFNVSTKTTKTEANNILEAMTSLKEIQDDEMTLFAKVQELVENCKDEIQSGYRSAKKIVFNEEGVISTEFAKKMLDSYFKDSDIEYSLKVKEGTKTNYRTNQIVPDNPEISLEIRKGNTIIVFDERKLSCKGWANLKEAIQIAKETSEKDLVSKLKEIKWLGFETINLEKIHD